MSLMETLTTIASRYHMGQRVILMWKIHNIFSCRVAIRWNLDPSCKNLWELILVLRSGEQLCLFPCLLRFSLRHINVLLNGSSDLLSLKLIASKILMRRGRLVLPIRITSFGIIVGAWVSAVLVLINHCVARYYRHRSINTSGGWLLVWITTALWNSIAS